MFLSAILVLDLLESDTLSKKPYSEKSIISKKQAREKTMVDKARGSDGSYLWTITKRDADIIEEIKEFNSTITKITLGHNGTAKVKPTNFVCQFSWYKQDGDKTKTQFKRGLGCSWNKSELHQAKERVRVISSKLQDKTFNWEWFDLYIKGISPSNELQTKLNKPLGQMIAEFKVSKSGIKDTSWSNRYETKFDKLLQLPNGGSLSKKDYLSWLTLKDNAIAKIYSKPLTSKQIETVINDHSLSSCTKKQFCKAIATLLKFHGVYEHYHNAFSAMDNVPKHIPAPRYIPSDDEIIFHYENSFNLERGHGIEQKDIDNVPNWKWLFGILATYGLRIHECWKIENWDKPVTLKAKQWHIVDSDDQEVKGDKDIVIPAFNDPNNLDHWLAISNETKTGYRLAMPLSSKGDNWVKRFDLTGKMRLPVMEFGKYGGKKLDDDKKQEAISGKVCQKFRQKITKFTPHCLRHAANGRGRRLRVDTAVLAKSLGHSELQNCTTYTKHLGIDHDIELLRQASDRAANSTNKTKEEALRMAQGLANGDTQKLDLLGNLINQLYN